MTYCIELQADRYADELEFQKLLNEEDFSYPETQTTELDTDLPF